MLDAAKQAVDENTAAYSTTQVLTEEELHRFLADAVHLTENGVYNRSVETVKNDVERNGSTAVHRLEGDYMVSEYHVTKTGENQYRCQEEDMYIELAFAEQELLEEEKQTEREKWLDHVHLKEQSSGETRCCLRPWMYTDDNSGRWN